MFKKYSGGWGQLCEVRFPLFEGFNRLKSWLTVTEEVGRTSEREHWGEERESCKILYGERAVEFLCRENHFRYIMCYLMAL